MRRGVFGAILPNRIASVGATPLRSDNFNRANENPLNIPSDAGTAWVNLLGTYEVVSNQGYGGGHANPVAYLECSTANVDISVNLSIAATNAGIAFRVVDASNFLFCICTSTQLSLWKKVAGVDTQIGTTQSITYSALAPLRVTVNSSSNITCYYNGASILAQTDTALNTATKHGMRNTATTNRFDDFVVYSF